METIYLRCVFICFLIGCINAMDDDFLCTEKHTYNITKRIKYQQPITTEFYEWCMNFPPRCAKSRTELRERSKMETVEKTENSKVCCPGFGLNKLTGKCTPTCPPALTGKACNESCQEGQWGKSCHKKCFCPNNAKCDPTDGKCICIAGWIGVDCNVPELKFTTTKTNLFDWSDPVQKIKTEYITPGEILVNKGPITSSTLESIRNVLTHINSGNVTLASKSNFQFSTSDKMRKEENSDIKTYTSTMKMKPIIISTELSSSTKTYRYIKPETTTMSDSKIIFINKIRSPSLFNHSSPVTKTRKNISFEESVNFIKPNIPSTVATIKTPVEISTPTAFQTTDEENENSTLQFASTYDFMQVIDKPDTYKNEDVTTNFEDVRNILQPTDQPDQNATPSSIIEKTLENLNIIKSTLVPLISNTTLIKVTKEIYHAVTNITHEQTTRRTVIKLPKEKTDREKIMNTTRLHDKMIRNKSTIYEVTTKSSFQVTVPDIATNATGDPRDKLEEILTEPEHITSVAGEKRSDASKDDFISIVSTATGVAIAIILVAIVIVFIERFRRRNNERNKNIGTKNIRSICEDDGPATYIRSIFHNPLPDPPICTSLTKPEPISPFYRQVVIHAVSPMMIENYRGILESHYDHLPCRDPRLASFQPMARPQSIAPVPVAPSTINNITFQTFNENSNNFEIPTLPVLRDCAIVTIRNENNNSAYSNDYNNEPLYDEIPNILPPSSMSQANEAMTEL